MNKTIGILAHVDAGKTTFSEDLLYHTGTIKKLGRVDYKNSFLDSYDIEKQRGITIFSDQAVMNYKGDTYYIIDTPGHVDFSPEMERVIRVMDYAIIIVSAVEGVQGHTETVWELLNKYRVPVFFFINKVDRVGADVDRILEEIGKSLTKDVCYIPHSLDDVLPQDVVEFLAEKDEELLELYINSVYQKDIWLRHLRKMVSKNQVYLCSSGSALQDTGIMEFFDNLHILSETQYTDGEFRGKVYKIRYDENGTKVTYLKILEGSFGVREEISYRSGHDEITEKVTQIRRYQGDRYLTIKRACAGQLVGITGLTQTWAGQGLGNEKSEQRFGIEPTLKSKVIFDLSLNIKDVFKAFSILNEEDPSLKVIWEEELQEIHIHVMGPIQLEILEKLVKDRFDFEVMFEEPSIMYKETIKGCVVGYGHFEPLKHYAEVHLKVEEGKRKEGIQYENCCHTDHLSKGNQNLVEHYIFHKEHKGILTGSPITDVKITLLTGRAHVKHTSGGDFRQATYRALRQGLEKAENVLLEPFYNFKIKVSTEHVGRVLSDIPKMNGTFNLPQTDSSKTLITGRAPVASIMNYPKELVAFTRGRGVINLSYGGYDICHNADEVIKRIAYDKSADMEYTSSSVFCSKGQSFIVRWDKAEEFMHCDISSPIN